MLAKYTNAIVNQLGIGNPLVQAGKSNHAGGLFPDH